MLAPVPSNLFTPLALMPEAPRGAPRSGERALLAAIVKDAIDIVRGGKVQPYARVTRDDAAAARRWIVEGDIGAITFNACCQWLDWDARSIRRAILERPPCHGETEAPRIGMPRFMNLSIVASELPSWWQTRRRQQARA